MGKGLHIMSCTDATSRELCPPDSPRNIDHSPTCSTLSTTTHAVSANIAVLKLPEPVQL